MGLKWCDDGLIEVVSVPPAPTTAPHREPPLPDAAAHALDLHTHGFARVAVAIPRVALGDPATNAARTVALLQQAAARGAAVCVFPELGLTGYSLDDLHQQDALLDAAVDALATVVDATIGSPTIALVGLPLRVDGRLFNVACVVGQGVVYGVVPKSYLPGYREYYEPRQFSAARDAVSDSVWLLGKGTPFGTDLLFRDAEQQDLVLHVEICEDLWVGVPPSTWGAFRGATVLCNLSAGNATVGKAAYRYQLCGSHSAKLLAAHVYSAAGAGESTTDLAWDGHGLIHENGALLAETERWSGDDQLVCADVDLGLLVQERARMGSWIDNASDHAARVREHRLVEVRRTRAAAPVLLERAMDPRPFVPADNARLDERCAEAYHVQVAGLEQRLRATGMQKLVIGISGGLDSTHALLVACQAMDALGLPRTNIMAWTLPGFATSKTTRENAHRLMNALGVTAGEIDIRPACQQVLRDLDHPAARGEPIYDITYENVQAGERTSRLFRLANQHDALVVGTGDLSELALGWCTYGVGDHMSHYNVNASVPKTLIQHLVGWVAAHESSSDETSAVLRDVLATEISPELVPGGDDDAPAQRTEDIIGPYELHDFTLYHVTRRGFSPGKVAYMALRAWARDWPGGGAPNAAAYDAREVLDWQRVFFQRFFGSSQFKRSCLPNGPKVGSGGSLSPRGDWRAPSDSSAAAWLAAHDAAAKALLGALGSA